MNENMGNIDNTFFYNASSKDAIENFDGLIDSQNSVSLIEGDEMIQKKFIDDINYISSCSWQTDRAFLDALNTKVKQYGYSYRMGPSANKSNYRRIECSQATTTRKKKKSEESKVIINYCSAHINISKKSGTGLWSVNSKYDTHSHSMVVMSDSNSYVESSQALDDQLIFLIRMARESGADSRTLRTMLTKFLGVGYVKQSLVYSLIEGIKNESGGDEEAEYLKKWLQSESQSDDICRYTVSEERLHSVFVMTKEQQFFSKTIVIVYLLTPRI